MDISVIISAYNEQGRIGNVLSTVVSCSYIHEIIVVNDGSTDGTAEEAKKFNVKVIDLPINAGKGAAMKKGIMESSGDWILFLDADLIGLTNKHIEDLVMCIENKQLDMSIGVFTKGRSKIFLSHKVFPFLSGQRLVRRSILDQMPDLEKTRFGIETAITVYSKKMKIKTAKCPLYRLEHYTKEQKFGWKRGSLYRWRMYAQMLATCMKIEWSTKLQKL